MRVVCQFFNVCHLSALQRGLLFNTEHKLQAIYILYICSGGAVLEEALCNEADDCGKGLASDLMAGRCTELRSFTPRQYIDRQRDDLNEASEETSSTAPQLPGAEVDVLKDAAAAALRQAEQRKLISKISNWNEYQVENEMCAIDFVALAGFNPEIAAEVSTCALHYYGLKDVHGILVGDILVRYC